MKVPRQVILEATDATSPGHSGATPSMKHQSPAPDSSVSLCRRVRGVVPGQWGALSNLLSVAAWCGRPVGWAESTHVAKEGRMSVYRVTDLIGTSAESWEDAAAAALKVASGTLRDLRVAEVVAQDIHVDESGGLTYRTKIRVSFKYEQ